MYHDAIFVPHHLQNLSSTNSLLLQKEHDFDLAGVTTVGVPVILPSTLPPQLGQNLASTRIEALHRMHVEVAFFDFFTGTLVEATLDDSFDFDFNFFCPLLAISATTIIIPATTMTVIKIG
jgi:hypothetical protein